VKEFLRTLGIMKGGFFPWMRLGILSRRVDAYCVGVCRAGGCKSGLGTRREEIGLGVDSVPLKGKKKPPKGEQGGKSPSDRVL